MDGLTSIKTKKDLKTLLNFLDDQGFGYMSDYELINKKINHIISKNNKLGVKYDQDKLRSQLDKLEDFDDMNKVAVEYFSKFSPDDKIRELLNTFYLQEDDKAQTPWQGTSSADEVITWVNFKRKYNLKDEFGIMKYVNYYNLDKNFLKIHFGDNWDFKKLYKLIYEEDCLEFRNASGEWFDIGKIEIKFFMNGSAYIKGDLAVLKDYYYKSLKNKIYYHTIIKYNGKTEIIKSTRE